MTLTKVDWSRASIEDRQILSHHMNRYRETRHLHWTPLLSQALGDRHISASFVANFTKGIAGRSHAATIHGWLRQAAPDLAEQVDVEVFKARRARNPEPERHSWQKLFETDGIAGAVEVLLYRRGQLNIAGFAEPEPLIDRHLYLLDHFGFRIPCPIAGTLAALEAFDREWYPLALSRRDPVLSVSSGMAEVPVKTDTGLPDPLSERVHAGQHGFAFLLFEDHRLAEQFRSLPRDQAISSGFLDGMAETLRSWTDRSWSLYRSTLMIYQASPPNT